MTEWYRPTERVLRERLSSQEGMTIVEVLLATVILATGVIAMTGAFTWGITTNKKQGEIATRTTLNAVSKLEELMALDFSDAATNTTVSPPAPAGGTGLSVGGGVNPANPIAGYVDYVDQDGTRVAAAAAFYRRQWQITTNPSGASKTITVVVFSNPTGLPGVPPSTTLVSIKANY